MICLDHTKIKPTLSYLCVISTITQSLYIPFSTVNMILTKVGTLVVISWMVFCKVILFPCFCDVSDDITTQSVRRTTIEKGPGLCDIYFPLFVFLAVFYKLYFLSSEPLNLELKLFQRKRLIFKFRDSNSYWFGICFTT